MTGFKLFLEGATRTALKTVHYPLGYGGIGLYPDAYYTPIAADAVLYISIDKRLYDNGDNKPFCLKNLPGHKQYGDKINNGEKEPFAIEKLMPRPKKPIYKIPQGKVKSFKDFVKLVTNPDEITPKCGKIPPA